MNDEVGHLIRPFSSFIIYPSTLLPAADLEAFAKEWFGARRRVEKLQAITTEGEIIDDFTAAASSAPRRATGQPSEEADGNSGGCRVGE